MLINLCCKRLFLTMDDKGFFCLVGWLCILCDSDICSIHYTTYSVKVG